MDYDLVFAIVFMVYLCATLFIESSNWIQIKRLKEEIKVLKERQVTHSTILRRLVDSEIKGAELIQDIKRANEAMKRRNISRN